MSIIIIVPSIESDRKYGFGFTEWLPVCIILVVDICFFILLRHIFLIFIRQITTYTIYYYITSYDVCCNLGALPTE